MMQKMGYWEEEGKIINHIWMTFFLFFTTNIWFFALMEDNSIEYNIEASLSLHALLLELGG
jgi:hypothetical protein